MKSVSTHEAKTHLSRLLAQVERGEEIIIRRGSVDVARLVPVANVASGRPRVGTVSSAPVAVSKGAFHPMTDEELEDWGL